MTQGKFTNNRLWDTIVSAYRIAKGDVMMQAEKKHLGQVFSPPEVIAYILDRSLRPEISEGTIQQLRILEPACGDGRFLTAAFHILLDAYRNFGFSQAEAAHRIVNNNLYALDIDTSAAEKARQVLQDCSGHRSNLVVQADALNKSYRNDKVPLGIPYYDVIIGNPPYVTWEITKSDRDLYRSQYQSAKQGKLNLYRLFIERSIELLKPGGVLGFICPNSYLTDRDSQLLRELIIAQTHILEICVFPETGVFDTVTQATTILILRKHHQGNSSLDHHIKINEMVITGMEIAPSKSITVRQSDWGNGVFRIVSALYKELLDKLYCGPSLDSIARIYQGEVNLTVHKQQLKQQPSANCFPLVRGCHIRPYGLTINSGYKKPSYVNPVGLKRKHALLPRLVLQQISNRVQKQRLKCSFIEPRQPIYCGNSTNYILLPGYASEMYYFIMGLCHSKVWNFLFNVHSSTNHITVRELDQLPLPLYDTNDISLVANVVVQLSNTDEPQRAHSLEQLLNDTVYQLYQLSATEITLIENYCNS